MATTSFGGGAAAPEGSAERHPARRSARNSVRRICIGGIQDSAGASVKEMRELATGPAEEQNPFPWARRALRPTCARNRSDLSGGGVRVEGDAALAGPLGLVERLVRPEEELVHFLRVVRI